MSALTPEEKEIVVASLPGLDKNDLVHLAAYFKRETFQPGERLYRSGDSGDKCYIVTSGQVRISMGETILAKYVPGDMFGEMSMLGKRAKRTNAFAAVGAPTTVVSLTDKWIGDDSIPRVTSTKLALALARRMSNVMEGNNLYKHMDVLIVQDGGCSPGYNTVTSMLIDNFCDVGRRVHVAREGFKSLVQGCNEDFRYAVSDSALMQKLALPGLVYGPQLRLERGAAFRTERFPQFKQDEMQKKAAANVMKRGVKVLVGIGGNGTFYGLRSLRKYLPDVQFFFIPCTIDSDVSGTESIGQHTGIEVGAEKIRCYMADASTHQRCYIVELMGRDGGFHCLHSALGGVGHLAIIPGTKVPFGRLAECINQEEFTVIAVAEGYARKERKNLGFRGNAAEYLHAKLKETGRLSNKKIVTEPFSRDVRGARVNNRDVVLSSKMAFEVCTMSQLGLSGYMPAVLSDRVNRIAFEDIRTYNSCSEDDVLLADNLNILKPARL